MALNITTLLDTVVGREDVRTSISSMTPKASAVGQLLEANGNPIRRVDSPVQAYTTLSDAEFSTWDNSTAKTANSLAGDVGEMVAATAYSIQVYPVNFEDDMEAFAEQFSLAVANGFAKYIDARVMNTASTGMIPLVSGVANTKATTVSSPTSYQLYTDLTGTMALVNADGFRVNGILSGLDEDANVLAAVSSTGQPVFSTNADGAVVRLIGRPYAQTEVNLANNARFVVGDWRQVKVFIYRDLKFETFRSGTVTVGGDVRNLITENLVAVRAEARMMFKVVTPSAFAYLYS